MALRILAAVLALSLGTTGAGPHQIPLRFGVYPGNTFTIGKYAGVKGSNSVAPDSNQSLQSMVRLANGRPFDVHLYAQWNRPSTAAIDPFIDRIAAAHLTVNLALKYVPPAGHDGDVAGFARWVAGVVRSHPEVGVFQVTNEANVGASSDSDGAAKDPVGALIEGVEAAARAKRRGQLIGFNWFYRLDPVDDASFWTALGTRGGAAFRHAVDYAGVDIYAGTYIPPGYSVDDGGDFRAALDYVRNEMMPLAGLGRTVPIFVQETGYPTLTPLRSEAKQAAVVRAYIAAAKGYGVGLLQWFQLTDARSPVGDGWGLVRADYVPKPAFDVMRTAGMPLT
ncbi:MAG: hypothetical protein ACYDH6_11595 [Acidimicrobiales bacterium]